MCLEDWREARAPEPVHCPTCREEVHSAFFERQLDAVICRHVEIYRESKKGSTASSSSSTDSSCTEVQEWNNRRKAYFDWTKVEACAFPDDDEEPLSYLELLLLLSAAIVITVVLTRGR
jgi:hypothetical protein